MNKLLIGKKMFSNDVNIVIIAIVFALLSVFSGIILIHSGFIGFGSDLRFHWQRIWELRTSILNGNLFPQVHLNRQSQDGAATMIMYPYISLYPIAILSLIIKNLVSLTYVIFIFSNFASMLIAFFSCYHFIKDKKTSFLFAVSYTMSTTILYYYFEMADFGMSASMIFMPLVIFGTMELLKNNNWWELSIGMTFILFCHVLSTIMVIITVIMLILFHKNDISRATWVSLFKATIAFLATTSIFWIPFVVLSILNKVSLPIMYFNLTGTDFNNLSNGILSNQVDYYINISAFVGLLLGLFFFKKLDYDTKLMLFISLIFIFVCSDFFPWNIINNTFVRNTLQFSWRLYVIPQILLCYVFARVFVSVISSYRHALLAFIVVLLAIVMAQLDAQQVVVNKNYGSPELTNPINNNTGSNFRINNNHDFKNLIDSNDAVDRDYLPKEALNNFDQISNHSGIYSDNKYLSMNLKKNGKFEFDAPTDMQILTLPFAYYNGINYQVTVDGKSAPFEPSSNQLMTIENVTKGHHVVTISVYNSWYNLLSYLLSLLGILTYVAIFIGRKFRVKF